MVEAIWDSISDSEEKPILTNEAKQILDARLEAHSNNPQEGSNWNDVKKRLNNTI